jgi:hypothetical protein
MCTVSILRLPGDLIRVACNRDEQISRAAALPPVVRRFGERRAVMPVDPVSNGAWIAVNDAGVVLTVLNYTPLGDTRPAAPLSRGVVIPALLDHATAKETASAAAELSALRYGRFRLLVIDHAALFEAVSDGTEIRIRAHRVMPASMFTSSGLGDHLVEGPRRELFDEFVSSQGVSPAVQDYFHAHQWADRRHLSVRMKRSDARTVSSTVIEVSSERIDMAYRAFDPPCTDRIFLLRKLGACCSSH